MFKNWASIHKLVSFYLTFKYIIITQIICMYINVSASVHAGIHSPPAVADTPQEQTPPWSRHPPGADNPREQTPPLGADIPPSRHSLRNRHPPEQIPPGSRHPPEQTPPGKQTPPPGSRLQHTVNERPVRILLECILVFKSLYWLVVTARNKVAAR